MVKFSFEKYMVNMTFLIMGFYFGASIYAGGFEWYKLIIVINFIPIFTFIWILMGLFDGG